MENIVRGPDAPLNDEEFGTYVFTALASQDPHKTIVINADTKEELTISEFRTKCIQAAYGLKQYVQQGDIIVCICDNEWISLVPIFASLYLGTTISLVNPIYNARELIHNFSQSNPKVVICTKAVLKLILEIRSVVKSIETIILLDKESVDNFPTMYDLINDQQQEWPIEDIKAESVDQNEAAFILSSSGTSGTPKGVLISYASLTASIPYIVSNDYIGISPDVTSLILVPLFHVLGLYLSIFSVICSSKVVFLKKFKPDSYLQALQDYRVTKLIIVPPLAIFLARSPMVGKYDLSNVNDILCGAAPLAQNILDMLQERIKVKVRQAYGLTESGGVCCIKPDSPSKPNSSGTLLHNLKAIVRDVETREILPRNSHGEICLKGPTVMKSYINNPEASKAAFDDDGYFLTGDIGYFDDDDYVFIVDRLKDLIKYKGFQVAPAELEGILLTHPAVKEVSVIGIPDERFGELPCAIIVKQPEDTTTEQQLIDFLGSHVSVHKQLTGGIKFLDDIPKNSNGKVIKRLLRDTVIK